MNRKHEIKLTEDQIEANNIKMAQLNRDTAILQNRLGEYKREEQRDSTLILRYANKLDEIIDDYRYYVNGEELPEITRNTLEYLMDFVRDDEPNLEEEAVNYIATMSCKLYGLSNNLLISIDI